MYYHYGSCNDMVCMISIITISGLAETEFAWTHHKATPILMIDDKISVNNEDLYTHNHIYLD